MKIKIILSILATLVIILSSYITVHNDRKVSVIQSGNKITKINLSEATILGGE